MFTLRWLHENGFEGFLSIKHLNDPTSRKVIPNENGVYVLFCDRDSGGIEILYIGKAGGCSGDGRPMKTTLRKRLSAYIRQSRSHSGGKIIWELEGYSEFFVCWKRCDNPRKLETNLLTQYNELYRCLPYANKVK